MIKLDPTYVFMINRSQGSAADICKVYLLDTFNYRVVIVIIPHANFSFSRRCLSCGNIGIDMAKKEYFAKGDDFSRKKEEIRLE